MAEDEPDLGVPLGDAVSDQQVGGSGGVEQEVRREGRDPGDGGGGKRVGVDEDDRVSGVEFGEQFGLAGLAEVGSAVVGEQEPGC